MLINYRIGFCFHSPATEFNLNGMSAPLNDISRYSDRLLGHAGISDFPGALNGLQLQNKGRVTRIAAAVDANLPVVHAAAALGADLLLVHHGIGWAPLCPVTGGRYELLKTCFDHNLAIYSSHLPLDAHPRLGNNALLCKALGFSPGKPFFREKGTIIGRKTTARLQREKLCVRLGRILGQAPILLPGGPEICRHIGIVTGGAGNELALAAADGIDTFITGEGSHWTFSLAHELGVNVIYGGHYQTETFGVKALASHLSGKFKLPFDFIDAPSGL